MKTERPKTERSISAPFRISGDAENRLITVTTPSGTATFVYDGDGNRVKKTENGVTTIYVGALFEKNLTTNVSTSYYLANGQPVALRQNTTVSYLYGDHLGSTSLTTDATGSVVARQTYLPYGQVRSTVGILPTDKGFTGQRLDATGLMFYNARYYNATIGRFVSADTVVPGAEDPQKFNRYAYMLNNPLKYTDPTGHCAFFGADTIFCGLMYLGMFLGGTAFMLSADSQLVPPDQQPSAGAGFALMVGAPLLGKPDLISAAGSGSGPANTITQAVCGDGDCTNEAAAGATTLSQAACSDGDCTNEVNAIAESGGKSVAETKAIASYWPPNRGFIGEPERIHLMPGQLVDRYGPPGGTFLSPKGTPFEMRGLPPSLSGIEPTIYQVVKPIAALKGQSAPAFGYILDF